MSRKNLDQIGFYTIVPNWVQVRLKADPRAVQVYAWLGTYANKITLVAWPKRQTLADDLGVSVKCIERALESLREAGAIATTLKHDSRGSVVGMEFQLIQVEPLDVQSDTDVVKDQSDTNVVKGRRQSDKFVQPKATKKSLLEDRTRSIELDPLTTYADTFSLSAPATMKAEKAPTPTGRLIAAYKVGWRERYQGAADFIGADAGRAKNLTDKHDADALVAAVEVYLRNDVEAFVRAQHSFAMFAANAGRLIAAMMKAGRPTASAMGDGRRCTHEPTCGSFAECRDRILADGRAERSQGVA